MRFFHFLPLSVMLISITLLLSSCGAVVFTEPQPAGVAVEESFPTAWQGIYKNMLPEDERGDIWIRVGENRVDFYGIRRDSFPLILTDNHESLQDGDSVQVNDRRYSNDLMGVVRGDWVQYEVKSSESLGLSDTIQLKLMGKYGFLNVESQQGEELFWDGVLIEPLRNGNLLAWINTGDREEVEAMSEFFEIAQKRVPGKGSDVLYATPRAEAFEKYAKEKGFREMIYWLQPERDYYAIPSIWK